MNTDNNSLISIIIPCFNSEQTICKCIDSVLNNSYNHFEIICINDGSNDNTLKILNNYKANYNNIIVVDQLNHKQGFCRNIGIDISRGEYIAFLDSDDSYDFLFLETMINNIHDNDVIICGYNCIRNSDIIEISGYDIESVSLETFWKLNYKDSVWSVVPWNKLFKKEVFKSIRFKENGYFEDEFFATDVFTRTLKIKSISNCLYNYVINDNGTMRTGSIYNRLFRAEARNERALFFIKNHYDDLYNLNVRENLYFLLKMKDYTKINDAPVECAIKLQNYLVDLAEIIDMSLGNGIHNNWDLWLFGKARFLFDIVYFARKIIRFILRRDSF